MDDIWVKMKIEDYLREQNKLITRKKLYKLLAYLICFIFLSSFIIIPLAINLIYNRKWDEKRCIYILILSVSFYSFILHKLNFLLKKFDNLFEKKTGRKLGLFGFFHKE